jgi:hypothetical protein
VDELATQITEMNYGADTYGQSSEVGQEGVMMFTEEASDYYNEKFDEYEALLNNTLNVWNEQGENAMIIIKTNKIKIKITMNTRKQMIDYILINGNDKTSTEYTIYDLSYRSKKDLRFIIIKITNYFIRL